MGSPVEFVVAKATLSGMLKGLVTSSLCLMLNCGIKTAKAETPATQPTVELASTAPVATRSFDDRTPMAFMVSYDQLAGAEPGDYRDKYWVDEQDTNKEDTQRVAAVESSFDAQVGMLQKMVQDKWGGDAAEQVLHAIGLKCLRDVQGATLKQMGRHASFTFSDGTPGPELTRVKAGWRLDMSAFCKSLGMPVDDYLKQIRQISKILPDVADGITNGKLKDPTAVVSDIVRRLNATPSR